MNIMLFMMQYEISLNKNVRFRSIFQNSSHYISQSIHLYNTVHHQPILMLLPLTATHSHPIIVTDHVMP